jgi:hypothetical protein
MDVIHSPEVAIFMARGMWVLGCCRKAALMELLEPARRYAKWVELRAWAILEIWIQSAYAPNLLSAGAQSRESAAG